ncbi:hypothetical protein [Pedobacter sp. GR22-10]|uniref:hypothetical protein n=1 Tax=Pedobacter sp. GR22-10 TaxID=2994472 RepID=UPI0022478BCF|nr:hypothetical protein [Pedobacter sp. GR22-10]MCX2429896.1 hypothetical protein [Pedobacter sp. GR22-10]
MTKQAFTEDGVATKEAELYALSSTDLYTETSQIRTDFKTWFTNNFVLDGSQLSYLVGIDPKFITSVASEVADSIENQLPIKIEFPLVTIGAKFLEKGNALLYTFEPNTGLRVSGQLQINIYYQ